MAQNYYAGVRTLSNLEMRQLFDSLKSHASGLHTKYAGEIQQRSRNIDTPQLLSLIKNR